MKRENLCLKCPVRGRCCYLSAEIEGHNVILDFQPCERLDTETGLCKDYEHRFEVKHCKNGGKKFNCGGLPEECLYLKDKPEKMMKVNIKKIAHKLTPHGLQIYNFLNNQPYLWELYQKELEKGNVYNALL